MDTLTVGNFDGVHLGHLKVIEKAVSFRDSTDLACFEPIARQFFADNSWNRRLTTVHERFELVRVLGIDRILLIPFDRKTIQKTPDEFL